MHVLNAAVDHADWCEWSGLISAIIMPITGDVCFRCPGCWASPRDSERRDQELHDAV